MTYAVRLKLSDTLRRIELEQLEKAPADRKVVPSITGLAYDAGYSRVAISNLLNENRERIDLEQLGRIVTVLRRRGFEIGVADLIEIVPVESREAAPV